MEAPPRYQEQPCISWDCVTLAEQWALKMPLTFEPGQRAHTWRNHKCLERNPGLVLKVTAALLGTELGFWDLRLLFHSVSRTCLLAQYSTPSQ